MITVIPALIALISFFVGTRIFNKIISLILSLVIALSGVLGFCIFGDDIMTKFYGKSDVATPVANTVKELPEYKGVEHADIYVSPNGSDENDGSLERPFKTIEREKKL